MPTTRPTRVRYLVVFISTMAAILLYLHRFCITFVQQYVQEDLQLTDQQMGWILSAFFWSYASAQVPSGWLSDRFGARWMLAAYIVVWSLFTGLMGLATSFLMFFAFRLGSGLGQAGAYPTSAAVVSKWMPFAARGTASSIIAGGGRMGAIIAPILTTYLVLHFVPSEDSSLLTSHDLMDVHRLCFRIVEGKPAPAVEELRKSSGEDLMEQQISERVGRRIRETLSSESLEIVQQLSEEFFDHKSFSKILLEKPRLNSPTNGQVSRVVAGLNEVLKRRDFHREADFAEVDLEREAQRLLGRPRDSLSPLEVQRLNRLILEAVYKEDIRKIYANGWRPVLGIYGLVGLLIAGLYWFCQRNRPDLHPWCNSEEVSLIEQGRPPSAPGPHGKAGAVPLKRILRSRSMWLISMTQFGTNVGWVFLVTWMPRYLRDVQHASFELRNWMATIVISVGLLGMFCGGRLTDWLARKRSLRWARALPIALTRYMAMGVYLLFLLGPSPWQAAALFALVAFSTDMGSPSVWAFKQDVGGRYVGSVLGWGNMWGNFGAALSPIIMVPIFETYGWDVTFVVLATAFMFAGTCALGVDASKPIAPPDEEDEEVSL